MTTEPIAVQYPGSPWSGTEDTAGTLLTLRELRAAWPFEMEIITTGSTSDTVSWSAEAALILDVAVSISNPAGALGGGSLVITADVSGQLSFGGSDATLAVAPPIRWLAGASPFTMTNVLGKANILTREGITGSRVHAQLLNSTDTAKLLVTVAPVAAKPTCT